VSKINSSFGPDWEVFKEEVKDLLHEYRDGAGIQGPPGSLLRSISVAAEGGRVPKVPNAKELYYPWYRAREIELERAREQAYLASTVAVQMWAKDKWSKSVRIPKEDAQVPWKPGHLLVTTNTIMQGHGFDSSSGASFNVRSLVIGAEVPKGTVVGKRLLGGETQYLVKPRGGPKEKAYMAAMRLKAILGLLRGSVDMMPEKQRESLIAERDKLQPLVENAKLGPLV